MAGTDLRRVSICMAEVRDSTDNEARSASEAVTISVSAGAKTSCSAAGEKSSIGRTTIDRRWRAPASLAGTTRPS